MTGLDSGVILKKKALILLPYKYGISEFHDGEPLDILHLYSDRMEKNIRHCFFNTQFSYGKVQIPHPLL